MGALEKALFASGRGATAVQRMLRTQKVRKIARPAPFRLVVPSRAPDKSAPTVPTPISAPFAETRAPLAQI